MAGHCLVADVPGSLVFPDGSEITDEPSTVAGEHELHSLGLPTDAEVETPATYTDEIETAVAVFLTDVIGVLGSVSRTGLNVSTLFA